MCSSPASNKLVKKNSARARGWCWMLCVVDETTGTSKDTTGQRGGRAGAACTKMLAIPFTWTRLLRSATSADTKLCVCVCDDVLIFVLWARHTQKG